MIACSDGCKMVNFWRIFQDAWTSSTDGRQYFPDRISAFLTPSSTHPTTLKSWAPPVNLDVPMVSRPQPQACSQGRTFRYLLKSLRKIAEDTFFEPRLVRRVFRRTSLCQVCGKSIITVAEIHSSAYDLFQKTIVMLMADKALG